ncbi:MAG: NAD(P)H-hydrate dehydratase [Clostridia bacterium]|nr:NAD(P)H-hydrate dehydratase [Clostridia bacterium]
MITDISFVKANLPEIKADAHKYSKGYAVIFAGSDFMAGAAILAGKSSLKSGAGIVRLVVPKSIYPICATGLPEAVYSILGNDIDLNKCNSVLFGCGVGQGKEAEDTLLRVLSECEKPLLIDADGINLLSKHIDVLKHKKCPVVLTPHEGEMSRLTGFSAEYIHNNRQKVASDFAKEYGVILLLKGKDTVISSPEGDVFINPTGTSALATAGSGDVLAGIITAFMAQGADPFKSAVMGAFVHGLSGEKAEEVLTSRCVTASDIIEYLKEAFKEC